MIESRLSLLGLYNWDNTIFDQLVLPTNVNRETFIDNLLMEVAELEILYPDFNFLKNAIGTWSKKMVYNWTLLDTALSESYDPLHNYDRTETKTEDESGTNTASSTSNGTGTNTAKVAGFNSSSLVNQNQNDTQNTGSASTNASNEILRNYTLRAYGNIGVTTSQQMLEAEVKLRQNFNIYDLMIMDFKDRFCLLVY